MSDLSDAEQYNSEQENDDSELTDREIRQFNRDMKKQKIKFEEDMKRERLAIAGVDKGTQVGKPGLGRGKRKQTSSAEEDKPKRRRGGYKTAPMVVWHQPRLITMSAVNSNGYDPYSVVYRTPLITRQSRSAPGGNQDDVL